MFGRRARTTAGKPHSMSYGHPCWFKMWVVQYLCSGHILSAVGDALMPSGPHNASDARGTEDPRVAYDPGTSLYYMFYTCWGDAGAVLCLATTKDPTSAGGWTRHGQQFPG